MYDANALTHQSITLCWYMPSDLNRFTELQTLVPTDPMLLTRLGRMYEEDNDKSMAFQCFQEVSNLIR